MSAKTSIEWTDRTWNPVRGCSVVSAGCKNCYAMHVAARFSGPGQAYEGLALRSPARWTGGIKLVEKNLFAPLSWRKPQRVFVNSMGDLFHELLADEEIDRVFAVMAMAQRHTFQVLTKRPERMRAYVHGAAARLDRHIALYWGTGHGVPWPLDNVWLGTSVEDQRTADERIPHLISVPAAVRFLSCEPLLGPLDLRTHLGIVQNHDDLMGLVDWVIVGGESGADARPMKTAWARQIIGQCRQAGAAPFVKQLGQRPVWSEAPEDFLHGFIGARALRDPKGGDPVEWPADLRVREFPEGVR